MQKTSLDTDVCTDELALIPFDERATAREAKRKSDEGSDDEMMLKRCTSVDGRGSHARISSIFGENLIITAAAAAEH